MEDLIEEAALSDNEHSEGEIQKPPKKKRKITKRKQKEEELPEPQEIERTEEEILRKKELELLLLKNPAIDVSKVLEISEKVSRMSPEQIETFLNAANTQLDLQCPFSSSQNIVTLGALVLQNIFEHDTIYERCINDSRLLAAVESFLPNFGGKVGAPLEVLGRIGTHLWDGKYSRRKVVFSPE